MKPFLVILGICLCIYWANEMLNGNTSSPMKMPATENSLFHTSEGHKAGTSTSTTVDYSSLVNSRPEQPRVVNQQPYGANVRNGYNPGVQVSGSGDDYYTIMRQATLQANDQSRYPKGSFVNVSPELRKHMNRNRTSFVNGTIYTDASGNPVGGSSSSSGTVSRSNMRSNSQMARDLKAEAKATMEALKNPNVNSINRARTYRRNNDAIYGQR